MDDKVLDVAGTAKLLYPDYEEHRKSKENLITRRCNNGSIRHARKIGQKWFINASSEWPELFGDEAAHAR